MHTKCAQKKHIMAREQDKSQQQQKSHAAILPTHICSPHSSAEVAGGCGACVVRSVKPKRLCSRKDERCSCSLRAVHLHLRFPLSPDLWPNEWRRVKNMHGIFGWNVLWRVKWLAGIICVRYADEQHLNQKCNPWDFFSIACTAQLIHHTTAHFLLSDLSLGRMSCHQ